MKPFLTTLHGVLYQVDCLELLGAMRSESIDCVFADPPFNLGKDYKNGFDDQLAQAHYDQWCGTWVRMGVEIQVSARSDMLIRDVVHLRNSLQQGEIDIGIIVVPSVRLQSFLTDRTPSLKDALRYVEQEFKEATTFPIVIIAIEHDAPGKALPKKKTNKA
jgi:site-specific DNA-methyltransferase (adenine-specific)